MEIIKPAFLSNNIPICFSSDDEYVPLLSVTIQSIMDKSTDTNNYDIVVLMTEISEENQKTLTELVSPKPNFSIRFVNVGTLVYGYKFFTEADPTNTKFSEEIYYRVLVPSLMANYSKVIFCDADLLFLDDIAKLITDYDISESLVGAVRDYEGIATCYAKSYERTRYRINELQLTNFGDYFNSGLLVMNIKLFNELFTANYLLDFAVSKNWQQFDQDVFNYLCKDKVTIIDACWNFLEDIEGYFHRLPEKLFNEYLSSEKSPKVIHFAGRRKPWIYIGSRHNRKFWETARKTPYYKDLRKKMDEDN